MIDLILAHGDHPNSRKNAPRMKRQMKILHVGAHQGVAPSYGFRIVQVVGCHSENGISYSENGISNSESCSPRMAFALRERFS